MDAHVEAARRAAADVPAAVAEPLLERAERLASEAEDPTGEMYSLALRYQP